MLARFVLTLARFVSTLACFVLMLACFVLTLASFISMLGCFVLTLGCFTLMLAWSVVDPRRRVAQRLRVDRVFLAAEDFLERHRAVVAAD